MTDDELKRLLEANATEMLDRRVRTLEEGYRSLEEIVSDLQARVDRLEGSTH